MRKMTVVLAVIMMSAALAACGAKTPAVPETEVLTSLEASESVNSHEEESSIGERNAADDASGARPKDKTVEDKTDEAEIPAAKIEDTAQSIGAEGQKEGGYEDNFAVESAAVSEFAEKIKTAVAAGDMEALADLTAFPVYVSIAKEGVKTREDFMALGAEKVFTPELKASIAGADTSNLSPSMAGFVVETDGGPNIIFGVVEGKLAISGINY